MYFSSLFPYVVLICFLVRGLLLRGAVDGILHMFTPKVSVWGALTAPPGLASVLQLSAHEGLLHVRQSPRAPGGMYRGRERGPCPQGSKERDLASIWGKSGKASERG